MNTNRIHLVLGEAQSTNFKENSMDKIIIRRTFHHFEKHFAKLSASLPEDQTLKIEVTNLDLAGDTHVGGIDRLRIIKNIYFPRMNFTYQLIKADGSIVLSDKVKLKDMNFMMGAHLKYRNEALRYEKQMLDDWFSKTFENNLAPQAK